MYPQDPRPCLLGNDRRHRHKEKVAHITYKDMEQLDFQIMLTDNYYPNQNLYFSIKIKKSSNKVSDIDTNLITVNNCFDHLIKEISTTRYENDKQLIANHSSTDIKLSKT